MDQNLATAKRGRRLVGEGPGRQATVVELVEAWEREGPEYTEPIRRVLQQRAAQMRTALATASDLGDLADAWDRAAGVYDEPARSTVRRCAGEVRAALLAVEDPEAYARLSDGELPPPARNEPVFYARHVVNVLDRVLGLGPDGHHNGYDSSRCGKAGCGRPWWDDEGHQHLAAEVMRELGLL